MPSFNRSLLWSALIGAGVSAPLSAAAETVWVKKDCSLVPCIVTGGPDSSNPGFFRLTASSFIWSANYTNTPGHFWVSQGGSNMATTRLSTSPGQLGGTGNLSTGNWFISIRTANMQPGTYSVSGPSVHGDPHITTTNGVHYDFQGAGEFVLAKHNGGFELQSRMTPVATGAPLPADPHTGLSSCVSVNTAAALRSPKHRVTYQPNISGQPDPSGMQLRIDGVLVSSIPAAGKTLSDGTKILRNGTTGELRAEFHENYAVRITPHWWQHRAIWYLDFDITPPAESTGLIGEIRRDEWVPALADGSSMGARPAPLPDRYKALYVTFADSWRVSDSSTLFDYAPGTSTKTYTMRTWPPEDGKCDLPFTVPLQGVSEAVADQACKGVFIPHMKRSCILDVMATGSTAFGKGYVVTQGFPKRKIKASAYAKTSKRPAR